VYDILRKRKELFTLKKLCILLALCLLLTGCAKSPDAADSTGSVTTESSTSTVLENTGDPDCITGHTDLENDGFCDYCSKFLLVYVDFYGMNDLHGKLDDASAHPGVDELSTFFTDAKAANENTILLSSGDMWQGSSESNLTHGLIMTDWMNEMGFAAMAMGNHEYDWGEGPILENYETAQFPLLAINIYDVETNKQVEYCKSSTIVDLGELQVGIIGAIGDVYSSISADKVQDVYFKTDADLTSLVKEEATQLRSQGADYIVYLLHDGHGSSNSKTSNISNQQLRTYYDPSLSQGYVDLVFEGHSHQQYVLVDSHGVYHLQSGGDNEGITHAEVAINIANGKSSVETAELVYTSKYAGLDDHPVVDQLLDKYADQISVGSTVLGTNTKSRNGNELRQLVADLYYKKGLEIWGDEYDIVLGGGYVSVRDPGYLAAGDVTYSMLYSLFPFDNNLVLCSIKGSDLQRRFFNSNQYYLGYGDYGKRLDGNLDPDGTYYVIVDTYSSLYAPNKLTEVARYDEAIYARDLLAEYAQLGGFQ